MAFNTAEGRAEYTALSSQTAFTFMFKIYTTSDIKVYQTPNGSIADDVADLLTITTDYTVSINGDDGGTVTLVSGATAGDTIVLVRELSATRTTDYQDNGDLFAATIDNDQNYQTYLIVDGYTRLARALLMPESLVGVSTDIPSPIADSYIKWNATADALENDTTIPDNVTLSQTAATTATTQAGIATTQAGLSAASATDSQLRAWEAEAEKMTADSYATEAEDVFVKTYASDGDGTFTATDTTEYSALHWAAKSALSSQGDAVNISYDNATSGLTATEVQGAIDEIVAERAIFDSSIVFEGATPDAFETTLTVTDPTADRTITFKDESGTVALLTDIPEATPSGVRQTVQSALVSSTTGLPVFLTTAASLNLPILATTKPIKIHMAGGAIEDDAVVTISADTTLLLPASSTSYIYATSSTTFGSTTLAPIYQQGGVPSVTNGQFTLNYGEMIGYLGNGTTAVPTLMTFMGEAITDGSTITSVVNYALNGIHDTSDFSWSLSSNNSRNHNIGTGVMDIIPSVLWKITTTSNGYTIGEYISLNGYTDPNSSGGYVITNITNKASSLTIPAFQGVISRTTFGGINLSTVSNVARIIFKRGW